MHPAPVDRPHPLQTEAQPLGEEIDLSVIIVNYNVREFLEQTLRSVYQAAEGLSVEVFVVDNNSIDGSVGMVRTRFPQVHLIANEHNVGFSKANNQAIRIASGRHLFILNPDTIVQEDTLSTLVQFMDSHPNAGAVGCKILNPDGTFAPESRRSFPTPAVAFYRMTGLSKLFPGHRQFGRYNLSYLSPDEATEVDALSGSCMVVRKAVIGIAGMFDEDFFMYGEDLDWCYRIQEAGWSIHYTPDTQIIHYKGESTKKGELRYILLFYGAMLRFAEKHFKERHSFFFRLFLRLGIIARGSLQAIYNWFKHNALILIESFLLFAIISATGMLRYKWADMTLPSLFIPVLAPAYTLFTTSGIAATGGYRRSHLHRLRPVLWGTIIGAGCIAALSFFIKELAFSRLSVLISFVVSVVSLSLHRLISHRTQRSQHLLRNAVLVGNDVEAGRLHYTLSSLDRPLMDLVGFISPTPCAPSHSGAIPCLGTLRHLRDLVRLEKIDDVIFASRIIPNRTAFDIMQQLKDLPVHFKMLNEQHEHLIGQASIEALSAPALIDAEAALGTTRSTFARRAFEVPLAILGIFLYPMFLVAASWSGSRSRIQMLAGKIRQFPAMLAGRKALIGYCAEDRHLIAPSWNLKPGVFTISESLPASARQAHMISRAYWLYTRNQSITLDIDVMRRVLRYEQ